MELSDNQLNECFPVQFDLHRETFNCLQLRGLHFAGMAGGEGDGERRSLLWR